MPGVRPWDGGRDGLRVGGRACPLKAPSEADFGSVIEQGAAGTEVGKVWIGHREALVADIEVESWLDGVGEAGGKLPGKVPLVGGVGADFG